VVSAPAAQAAADEATPQQGFARWIADFRAGMQAAGIDEATLRVAFDDVQYLPRVVELDRAQPEFTRTVWDYLDRAVTAQRVARGQDKLAQVRSEADAAAARYGVPPAIVVAIWGIESNYGDHTGNAPTIDALATLGFDGRREGWARGQLLAALKILQSGDIPRANMIGSWAGATAGAAQPTRRRRPRTFSRARDGWPISPGAPRCSCRPASMLAAPTAS